MVSPACRAAATKTLTSPLDETWLSTATAAPACCLPTSRCGRRRTGGAVGVSATATGSPNVAASEADLVPSRSKAWVTSDRKSEARPAPVTHSTVANRSSARAWSSCSSAIRFRSRQVSVTQGFAPVSAISRASVLGE